ncbi:hypothetical protein J1P26_21885 [Neobacillus sp. MM2021_6]|uniref:hypothetical protein n=1 Tax=Bacillaceae TaxID=186817 RepID=UPI00140A0475|nr:MULTISPECIES: hypothetical protein [Bacillaceae]MBO0962358.1 hypothetical protein [Neobacillus sp. MM2021_6]NHC20841.1 hypothetical protein [Bacillus sp. MM2020_4]
MKEKIFESLNTILDFFRKKIKNAFISFILGLVLIFAICIALMFIFKRDSIAIANTFSWSITAYCIFHYFKGANAYKNKQTKRKLENDITKEININLFQWVGQTDLFGESLYVWLRKCAQADIASNLKLIKQEIVESVGESIYDYYLLKDYLEYYAKNNFLYKLWTMLFPILLSSFTGIIAKVTVWDNIFSYFLKKIPENDIKTWEQIELIVQVGAITFIVLSLVIFIRSELTRDKRIIDLVIKVVDSIIKEREETKKEES